MSRARRTWRIVQRFGRYYVENQFGGFSGWHNDYASAVAQGREYVAKDGDTFIEGVQSRS